MSFNPPEGILDIGNATLRVGKLEVSETLGLNQGLQNIVKNNLLITETTSYTTNQKWGLKLPTTWVAEFEVKGHTGKYIDFNFYNENSASNAQGYNLTFKDTTMTLRYDGGSALGGGAATIPTIVGAFRKVNIFFERGVLAVSIDGTRYLYHKETDGFNNGVGAASRVVSATGGAFVNLFIEANAADSAFKNLRIVNDRFISDKTSNIAFVGGNLGVGVNSPQEALDIRGNMHFERVSNVSQIKVSSNVVAEYTGPHDRPLRKYPEVAMTANDNSSTSGYVAGASSQNSSNPAYHMFDGIVSSRWLTQGTTDSYDTTSPYLYNGSRGSNIVDISGTPHNGIWLKLELPKAIKLDYNIIRDNTDPGTRTPGKIAFLGSTNGTDWTFLKEFSGMSNTASVEKYTINDTNYYNHFAFVVKNLSDDDQYLDLGEWELYGHEEGDSSLDTTLKSVYNVPGTQQLEVYYDGQDFSGTPSSITDKSGNNITATANNITIDTTYNSFEITSSPKSNIIADNVTFVSGDEPHTYALWVRLKNNSANNLLIDYRPDGGTSTTGNAAGVYILNSNKRIQFYHQAADIQLDYNFVTDTWYHIICSYSGGGNNTTNSKIYINGTEQTNSVVSGSTSVLSLPATGKLTIGDYLYGAIGMGDGNIGNVRLFSKALNADQVRELYDYQKDYFLGSRSSVTLYKGHLGIGVAEPSGQLELAGDERIQEYPPRDLGGFETLVEGQGTYKVSSSSDVANPSVGSSDHPATAFTNDDIFFRGANVQYGVGNAPALYTGTHFTNGVGGDFLQIELPHEIYLKSINIAARTSSSLIDRAPHTGSIFGSNDGGTTWSQVASWSGLIWTVGESKPIQINSSVLYSTYRLVANKLANTSGNASRFNIDRWQLFGTPGPTTLDKGSLTLGRSLDVPRISRYDVDTETPRPEKLVVDFDTTVNSSPTDISGQGNHGTLVGATYSPADKAFSFDGTDDYIKGNLNNTGDTDFTVSLWLKKNTSGTVGMLWNIGGSGGSGNPEDSVALEVGSNNNLNFFIFSGAEGLISNFAITYLNRWVHIVATRSGNNLNVYLDGIDQNFSTTGTDTLQLAANTEYTIGARGTGALGNNSLNGLISNPKLYSVVLEASEVQKLYRLGRTGRSMVISDTAVGIGKVPEAQLDVRGVAQFGSIYAPGTIIQVKHNGGTTGHSYSSAASAGTSGDMSITYATGFKLSITPRSTKSQIYVNMNVLAYFASQGTGTNGVRAQVFRKVGTTYTRVYGRGGSAHDLNRYGTPVENLHTYLHISFVDSAPNTLETVEYELRAALYNTTGTLQIGNNNNQPATITLMEIGGE